jgi:hypothetical protein
VGVISACTVVIGELPEGKDPTANAGGEAGGGVAGSLAGNAGSAGSDASSGGGSGGIAGSAGVAGTSGGGTGGTTCKAPPCDCDGDNHYAETTECGGDDCDDKDNRAFEGQTQSFFTPTLGNGDFDFDCDGAETPELPLHNCTGLLCAGSTVGFIAAPTCGTMGTWAKCVGSGATGCAASPDGQVPVNCH